MRRLFVIALRNVTRNKLRSAISLLAILVGVLVSVFLKGFTGGFLKNVVEDAVLAKVGAIQVHRRGYLEAEKDPLKLDMPDDAAFVARLRAVPGVRAATRRIAFEGMLSNGSTSAMFVASAIDPKTEYEVCPKRRASVAPGSQPLDDAAAAEALIGKQIVAALEAKQGSTLNMLSATQGGAQNALDVTVRGYLPSLFIFESKRMTTVPLAFAQDLLRMHGRVTEYALAVDDLEGVEAVAARLRDALGPDYEVTTWPELAPMARDAVVRVKWVLFFVGLILFLLVLSGIVNTMLMNVSERVREIGTMLAVGVRRRHVLLLFLIEAAVLGLVGASAGAAAGWAIVRRFGRVGLTLSAPGGDPQTFFPYVEPPFVALAVGIAIAGAVLAALYPSWKASRLRPVEALRAT